VRSDDYRTQDAAAVASGAAQELLPSSVSARSRLDDVAEDDLDASSRCCGGWLLRHDTATTSAGSGSIALTALSASCAPESAVRVADIDFRIARARGRVDSLEGATKRGSGGALGVDGSDGATSSAAKQLDEARRELVVALRMRDDAETDRKLAEMRDRRNAQLSELRDSHRHATLFVRVAAWQNVVTYLVYVIMLLNVIITTFGMSGEDGRGLGERHIPPLGPPMSRVGRGRRTGVGA